MKALSISSLRGSEKQTEEALAPERTPACAQQSLSPYAPPPPPSGKPKPHTAVRGLTEARHERNHHTRGKHAALNSHWSSRFRGQQRTHFGRTAVLPLSSVTGAILCGPSPSRRTATSAAGGSPSYLHFTCSPCTHTFRQLKGSSNLAMRQAIWVAIIYHLPVTCPTVLRRAGCLAERSCCCSISPKGRHRHRTPAQGVGRTDPREPTISQKNTRHSFLSLVVREHTGIATRHARPSLGSGRA